MERVGRADGREIGYVVDHRVADTERGLAISEHVPGEACARSKVAQIEVVQTRVTHPHTDQPRRSIAWRTDLWLRRRARVKVRGVLICFTESSIDFPTQAVADRQSRSDLPFILEKDAHGRLIEMTGSVAKRARGFINPADEQLCKDGREVELETAQRGPCAIPQAERGGIVVVAAKLKRMRSLDPGEVSGRVIVLRGARA